jgi:uncharacterized protein YbjT (DUF2867 family)
MGRYSLRNENIQLIYGKLAMSKPIIGVLGGSGFVGSYLSNELIQHGYAVRIITRKRENAKHLWILPDTEIKSIQTFTGQSLNQVVDGCIAVVNLVGILNEKWDNGKGFKSAHTDVAESLLKACEETKIPQLIQISALNANKSTASHYLSSKNKAEAILLAKRSDEHTEATRNRGASRLPKVTILRPSVIFGSQDSFTNRFHTLLKFSPPIFPLPMGHTRVQPIYVGDVVKAILKIIQDPRARIEAYDIVGPEILTLKEIVEYIAKIANYRTKILPLGNGLSAIQANILQYCPGKPFSRDNLRSLQVESICTDENGLSQLNITPTSMDSIVPRYLAKRSSRFAYYKFRDRT